MPHLEVPDKRFATTIWLDLPGHRVFVDSWEEAMEIAEALRKSRTVESDRSTTVIHIEPLEPTSFFYKERRLREQEEGRHLEENE